MRGGKSGIYNRYCRIPLFTKEQEWTMVSIFHYFDYRDFLKDYYAWKKQGNPFFSYRFLGRKIGLDASSLLKVMQKQLHISSESAPKIIQYLKLNEKEASYFSALVLFNKAKSNQDIEKYFKLIIEQNSQQVKHIDEDYRIFYSQWYYKAIYMLLFIYPFTNNPSELANRLIPAISEAEFQKAIFLLEQYGFIRKQQDGSYHALYKVVSPDSAVFNVEESEIYDRQVAQLGLESFDRFTKEDRRFVSFCIRLSDQGHSEMMKLFDTFKTELLRISTIDGEYNRVYQVNAQFFPLSDKSAKPLLPSNGITITGQSGG